MSKPAGFACQILFATEQSREHYSMPTFQMHNWGGILSDPAIQLAHALASIGRDVYGVAADPGEVAAAVGVAADRGSAEELLDAHVGSLERVVLPPHLP